MKPGKTTARPDGEFVVFLLGARVNRWWKVHKWLPIARAMPRMMAELQAHPELGLLHAEGWAGRTTIMVQYWRSLEHLMAYARNKHRAHLPAWREFNRRIGDTQDVGVWHETYVVKAGCAESLYSGMPRFGLGAAFDVLPAKGPLSSARGRLARARVTSPLSRPGTRRDRMGREEVAPAAPCRTPASHQAGDPEGAELV